MLYLLACAAALMLGLSSAAADTHVVTGTLGNSQATKARLLAYFSMMPSGDLLSVDRADRALRVIAPGDRLKAKIAVPFVPYSAIALADGTFLVAGGGQVAILDKRGQVKASGKIAVPPRVMLPHTPGLAVTDDYVFLTATGNSGFSLWRYDRNLQNGKELMKSLRGCCSLLDIASDGTYVYVAENARHHVIKCDLDGNRVSEFGKYNVNTLEEFGGCCEPKNIFPAADGGIYTSESYNCRIKYYAPDGSCTLIGFAAQTRGCEQVCVAVSRDGSTVYFLDSHANVIRVLKKRP
jgi:sugar lactone lactonase YvrE